jgi:hypothetical protein
MMDSLPFLPPARSGLLQRFLDDKNLSYASDFPRVYERCLIQNKRVLVARLTIEKGPPTQYTGTKASQRVEDGIQQPRHV